MRVGPLPVACGVADETTSFGENDASAEPANASEAKTAPASAARRMAFFMWSPSFVSELIGIDGQSPGRLERSVTVLRWTQTAAHKDLTDQPRADTSGPTATQWTRSYRTSCAFAIG